ncbi:hypothetical protein M8C21_004931, partial [Ambrosia artemisiifolia]
HPQLLFDNHLSEGSKSNAWDLETTKSKNTVNRTLPKAQVQQLTNNVLVLLSFVKQTLCLAANQQPFGESKAKPSSQGAQPAASDAEVANGKGEGETVNLIVNGKEKKKRKAKSKNKRPTLGDILNPQYLQNLEAARGEMDSVSQQRKRKKTMNNNPDLGDKLSTHESTQEGLIITKVFEVKSGETVLAKTATIDANIVSNGDHAEVSIGKTGEGVTTILNVNGKGKKKKKPKSKNKRPALSEILNPQYLHNLEAAERGSGTHESTQEGLSEMVSGKTATSDANMVSKGDETNNFNVNGKEKKKKIPKSKNKGTTKDVLVERPEGIVADKYFPRRAVFKRPYLDDFLCFCFERFEVGIWSSRVMKNLVPVINFMFGDLRKKLLFMWCFIKPVFEKKRFRGMGHVPWMKFVMASKVHYKVLRWVLGSQAMAVNKASKIMSTRRGDTLCNHGELEIYDRDGLTLGEFTKEYITPHNWIDMWRMASKDESDHLTLHLKSRLRQFKWTTKRKRWVNQGIKGLESIVDHMYRMALVALIADYLPGINRERAIKIALVHDIAEDSCQPIYPSVNEKKDAIARPQLFDSEGNRNPAKRAATDN